MLSTVKSIIQTSFPSFRDERGVLSAYEANDIVPYEIARIFIVSSNSEKYRGHHAHIACSQLMVCVSGECILKCDDGSEKREFVLDNQSQGVLIPPMIWTEQFYLKDSTSIMVICDRPYEKDDYIREYQEFLSRRAIFKEES